MRKALIWAALALAAPGAAAGEIRVSAAVSLANVLQELAAGFEAEGGGRLVFNFGPSNTVARQIEEGAPADLFISADEVQMARLARAGVVSPAAIVPLLSNVLAVVVPDDRAGTVRAAADLLSPSIRRIAIGDPAAVPAGVYARRYFERLGVWGRLAPRLVPSASVRAALAAVDAGSVDAAVVYRTDLAAARRARLAFEVPREDGPRIVYPAAVLSRAANPAGARRFLEYLRGPAARNVFERHGFITLTGDPAS